jgi:hypothetical protein
VHIRAVVAPLQSKEASKAKETQKTPVKVIIVVAFFARVRNGRCVVGTLGFFRGHIGQLARFLLQLLSLLGDCIRLFSDLFALRCGRDWHSD